MCFAIACQQETPPPGDEEFTIDSPAPAVTQVDVAAVIEHLKANQMPIGRTDIYNAENDPSRRLGRPGEYVGKAIFHDTRFPLTLFEGQDVLSFQASGGVVETFLSSADVERRKQTLDAARQQFPTAPPEYQYTNGVILLRLGHVFTPEQAQQYEAALASFQA